MSDQAASAYKYKFDDSSLSTLGFWGLVFLGIWLWDWVPFRNEIAVYEVACIELTSNGQCAPRNEYPGIRTNYRPDRDTKSVVFWVDGNPPQKFDNCAIADVYNWSCPGYTEVNTMVEGKLVGRGEQYGYPHQTSKFNWWWLKLKKM